MAGIWKFLGTQVVKVALLALGNPRDIYDVAEGIKNAREAVKAAKKRK